MIHGSRSSQFSVHHDTILQTRSSVGCVFIIKNLVRIYLLVNTNQQFHVCKQLDKFDLVLLMLNLLHTFTLRN